MARLNQPLQPTGAAISAPRRILVPVPRRQSLAFGRWELALLTCLSLGGPTSNSESNANVRKEGSMKKGYWVVAYRSISDASAVKSYGTLAVPAVQSFGGRFLTMSASQMQAHEAALQQPTVLVEFDSFDIARSAHDSEAYQKALQALGSGAERDFRIVEGA
jgi:uncharacterized protein (DUF1330 family)